MLDLIDRFGASAVLPSPTPLWILKRLRAADIVMSSYIERERAENWGEWESANPGRARVLRLALRAAVDMGMIEGSE